MALPSEKDILFEKVHQLFQKSNSITAFEKALHTENIKPYYRLGKLTGVYFGKRKYRLKRSLGIDIQILLLKDKTLERIQSLDDIMKVKAKNLSKDYDIEL